MKDAWPSRFFGFKPGDNKLKSASEKITEVPIELIDRNSYQPRERIDSEKVDELAQSIKTYGLLQPVILRKVGGRYEIVAGERRFLALKKLNKESIKAIIKTYSDSAMAALAMIENLQREDLNVIEEAKGYKKLMEEFSLTQEVLAQRLGKSQSTIANKLRLLNLPDEVKKSLMDEEISERHARSLLKLRDGHGQVQILREIREKNLNVKQTEERIDIELRQENNESPTVKRKVFKRGVINDYRILLNTIKKAVSEVKDMGFKPIVKEEEYKDRVEIKISLPKNIK